MTEWSMFDVLRRIEALEGAVVQLKHDMTPAEREAESLGSLPARDAEEIRMILDNVRSGLNGLVEELADLKQRLNAIEQRMGKPIKDRVR